MKAFKFACPVCGQHINADSEHTGSQLECPTCYQQLIVPQAPESDDPKFIISAAQVRKARPNGLPKEPEAGVVMQPRKVPWVAIAAGLILLCGVAAAVVFHGSIFGSKKPEAPPVVADDKPAPAPTPAPAPLPAVVADPRWNLDVTETAYPDGPVVGKIHGSNFICDRAYLQNGVLTLRQSKDGGTDLSISVTLAKAGQQMGLHYSVNTSTVPAPKVMLRWKKEDNSTASLAYSGGYGLKLDMENVVNNTLPGKIYICMPDENKSFLCGAFVAEIKQPKAKK